MNPAKKLLPQNDDMLEYVKQRLEKWAEWFSKGNWCGLGYPPCSLEYRLMMEGIIVRSTAPRLLGYNEETEEMEMLVKEMGKHAPYLALAVRCHYFTRGSLRDKGKKINVSHNHFKHYVDMAHQWLIGRLSVKY